MKKLVSVLFVSLLVGGLVFAADPSVKVGGWGRYIYNLVEDSDGDDATDLTSSTDPSWGNGGEARFTVTGTSDNVGFRIDMFITSMGDTTQGASMFRNADNVKMWVKFNDMFTLQGGRLKGDVLRGKIGSSDLIGTTDEDAIFTRFSLAKGLLFEVTPMKGVYAAAKIDSASGTAETSFEDTMKKIQLGAGYVIDGVGHLRGQYIGAIDSADAKINAAFAYTGMKGLLVDAGAFIPLGDGTDTSIGISAKYSMDALSAVVRTQTILADDLGLNISADIGYGLSKVVIAGAEVQYIDTTVADADTTIKIAPYAKLAYSNGYFKAAFFANITGDVTTWSVPLLMNYAF